MPQETKAKGIPAQSTKGDRSLQGLVATRDDERALLEALEKAFDYRGDCTITRADATTVTGYIFDRRTADTLVDSILRLMTPDSDTPVVVRYSEIDRLEFTGRDMAHGKSFETWVTRFIEKKLSGEKASIESEPLE